MSNVLMAAGSPIRLVEGVHHAGQQADIRRDLDHVQVDAELAGDLPGADRVVEHGLESLVFGPEGDGVGVDAWYG
jgi:hypothetical protein